MREEMRRAQIGWPLFIAVLALLAILFAWGLNANNSRKKELAQEETGLQYILSQKEQERLTLQDRVDDVGSKGYIESHARSDLNYLKPGELRFQVVNAEFLDAYTEEEWQAVMNEKALDGR